MLIGLTGMYCAGKNYVAGLLEKQGIPVLDVDKLGHQVLDLEREAILRRFGEDILGEDGRIDRKRLGARVFGKPGEMAALEGIVHPRVNDLTREWVLRQGERICVINAALLHRSVVFGDVAGIILVKAPFWVRLLRARRRDALPWSAILKRFFSQRNFLSQYFLKNADIYIVENGVSLGVRSSEERLECRLKVILAAWQNEKMEFFDG